MPRPQCPSQRWAHPTRQADPQGSLDSMQRPWPPFSSAPRPENQVGLESSHCEPFLDPTQVWADATKPAVWLQIADLVFPNGLTSLGNSVQDVLNKVILPPAVQDRKMTGRSGGLC